MRHLRLVCAAALVGLIGGGLSSCESSGSSPGAEFCQSWAAAFCQKLYACPVDASGQDTTGGASQAQCTQAYAALCSSPQQSGQIFDVNCSGGARVDGTAKAACLDELSTVTCDTFNSPDYMSVCTQVCSSGATGGTGGGSPGTGGTGGGNATGGTGGGATACGTVEPCGGNLLGTWTFTSACQDVGALSGAAQFEFDCQQATVTSANVTISGSASFNADMSYSITQNITDTIAFSLPASCTSGLDCASYAAYVAASDPAGTPVSCSGTTTCACTQISTHSGTDAGTYLLSGSDATITSNTTGLPSTNGYCVQGSTIHLITVDTSMSTGPGGQATIGSDIVGQKD